MTPKELESMIARILAGVTFFKSGETLYKILEATPEQHVLADYIIDEACEDLIFGDNFIPRGEAEIIHQRMGTWTSQDNSSIKTSEEHIDDLKIALYKTMMSKKKQEMIKKQLDGVRKALHKAYFKREAIYASTIETHKQLLKEKFLIAINITDLKGKFYYTIDNFWTQDAYLMDKAVDHMNTKFIPQEGIREASRKQPWRSYWNASKADVFSKPLAELGSSQRLIITYSQMYDNARQHPECPPDNVFEDDDLFDGWMLHDNKKRVKEQRQKTIDGTVGNKGDEVFVVAHDQEEANEIFDVNHDQERFQVKRRFHQLKGSDRPLDDIELIDNQEKLRKLAKER